MTRHLETGTEYTIVIFSMLRTEVRKQIAGRHEFLRGKKKPNKDDIRKIAYIYFMYKNLQYLIISIHIFAAAAVLLLASSKLYSFNFITVITDQKAQV